MRICCKTYMQLLRHLHKLIRTGRSDSPEADAVRHRMDDPWKHLTSEEVALVRKYSSSLYRSTDSGRYRRK